MVNTYRRVLPSFFLLLIFTSVFISTSTHAETIVNASINSNTTWDSSRNPYVVSNNVLITNSVLTISPGVIIEFLADYKITFGAGASVQALGEAGAEIHFMLSPTATTSSWDQILFVSNAVDAGVNSDGSFASGSLLKYVIIENTNPTTGFGAVQANTVTPYFDHVTIKNNQKGAIYITNLKSTVMIRGSSITNNNLLESATIPVIDINGGTDSLGMPTGNLVLEQSTVSNNGSALSSASPAIISFDNSESVRIVNSVISNNHAYSSSAIKLDVLAGDITQNLVEGNVISGNMANLDTPTGKGGAIFIGNTHVTIRNNLLDYNTSNNEAGAIYFTKSIADISKNIFSNNTAGVSTGALRIDDPAGDFDITENIFYSNTAQTGHGAGIHTHNGGTDKSHVLNIHNNLFIDNRVLPLVVSNTSRINAGDCIYIADSDAIIDRNVFTGQGFMNCVFLANLINGGITNNVFYANYNNASLIRLFNDSGSVNPSAENTLISQNNFFSSNVTGRYVERTTASDPNVMNLSMNWWDGADLTIKLPPNTDTSSAMATPNATPPLSAPQNVIAESNNGLIDISWDANPEPDVAGYNIYWVIDGEYLAFDHVIDAGLVTQYSMTPETSTGSYTIAITAYKTSYDSTGDDPATKINDNQTGGTESWFSASIPAIIAGDILPSPSPSPAPGVQSSGGGSGGGAMHFSFLIAMLFTAYFRRRYHYS